MKVPSIIKENGEIYVAICTRKQSLGLTYFDICTEAAKYNVKISKAALSNYFKRKPRVTLTEQAILWICDRYGIDVSVIVDAKEYNEFNSLLKTKVKYGKQ